MYRESGRWEQERQLSQTNCASVGADDFVECSVSLVQSLPGMLYRTI